MSTFTRLGSEEHHQSPALPVRLLHARCCSRAQHRRSGSWRAKSLWVNWSSKLSGPAAPDRATPGDLSGLVCWWPGCSLAAQQPGVSAGRWPLASPLETRQGFKNENAGLERLKKVSAGRATPEGPRRPFLASSGTGCWQSSASLVVLGWQMRHFQPAALPSKAAFLMGQSVYTVSPLCLPSSFLFL